MDKGKSANKSEFLSEMIEGTDRTKAAAEKALNWVLDTMVKLAKQGKGFHIIGYCALEIQDRSARDGRNPKTGEKMRIAAYKQAVFRAGKKFKEACNE